MLGGVALTSTIFATSFAVFFSSPSARHISTNGCVLKACQVAESFVHVN